MLMGIAQGNWSSDDLDRDNELLTCRQSDVNTLFAPNLLVFLGRMCNDRVVVLIDSGASRNFLSHVFAQKQNLSIDTTNRDTIRLANGHKVQGHGTAKSLKIHIGSYTTRTNFSVTQLTQGYDVILGKP